MPKTVLLVDNDSTFLSELSSLLNAEGYVTVAAENGREARFALDSPQASRGKFIRCLCTTAGFTPVVLDGYGLRNLTLTRPTEAPRIQFLFVGSHVCSTLPSDTTSR